MSLNSQVQEIVRDTRRLPLPRSLIVLEAQLQEHGAFWSMVHRLSLKYQFIVMTARSPRSVAADLDEMRIPAVVLPGECVSDILPQQGRTWNLESGAHLNELCVVGYPSDALADTDPPSGIERIIFDPEIRLDYYERILVSLSAAKSESQRRYGVNSIPLSIHCPAAAS